MKASSALGFAVLVGWPLAAAALDRVDADHAMTKAASAVETAQRGDAAQFAAPDLATAQAMLERAQAACDGRHWTDAVLAAENAELDADLAAARSRQHRAEAAMAEVERSVDALRVRLGMPREGRP